MKRSVKVQKFKEGFSYRDKLWQELRKEVRKLYGFKCMKCNYNKKPHIDHIKPKSKYPKQEFNPKNLQILCERCNIEKSNKYVKDYRTPEQVKAMDIALSTNKVLRRFWVGYKKLPSMMKSKNKKWLERFNSNQIKKKPFRKRALKSNSLIIGSSKDKSKPKTILRKSITNTL